MENKHITVNYDSFALPKIFTDEYGDFKILQDSEPLFRPHSFAVEDIDFVTTRKDCSGLSFKHQVLSEELFPLDGYVAQSLFRDESLLRDISSNWWKKRGGIRSGHNLKTLSFFGTLAVRNGDESDIHIISYKYDDHALTELPKFVVYEAEDYWFRSDDWAAVFTKKFVQNSK